MAASVKYDNARTGQISRIRRYANNAILIVWLAGLTAVSILLSYFYVFSENAQQAVIQRKEKKNGITRLADETVFADKTALVNIGLRMQAIREDSTLQSPGTIGINKIIHDQKLSKVKKQVVPVPPPVKKVDFAIKAVPQ